MCEKIMIGERGKVLKGDMAGFWIMVEDDYENTGGYLILYAIDSSFSKGGGYDAWVENRESLEKYFDECRLEVDWEAET